MADSITLREFVHKIGFAVSLGGLNEYEKTLQRVEQKEKQMFDGADKLIGRLESIGKSMMFHFSLPMTALAGVSISARAHIERTERQWGVFLGRMSDGVRMTRALREEAEGSIFNFEEVNQYAESLHRLRVPIAQIMPMIRKFGDIQAGTGQNAGELMNEYAMARNNPIMRGMLLTRLMRQGAITEADIRAAGLNPILMRRQGSLERLGMGSFEKIFSSMAERNQGKMGLLAGGDLQKNLGNFWDGITRIREALGGMIEKVTHLVLILKAGTYIFKGVADWIANLPGGIKTAIVSVAAFVTVIGPAIFLISKLGGVILGLAKALVFISLNPLVLEIAAVIAAVAVLLLVARQVNIEIRKFQGKDKDTVAESNFMKAGGRMNQFTGTGKGAVSDALSARPVFNTASAGTAKYTPRDIFGTGTPVVIHNSTTVNVHPGATAATVAAAHHAASDLVDQTAQHIVTQLRNARGR